MRKAVPAKGIRPTLSPSSLDTKSMIPILLLSRRLGFTSLASMLLEVSTAMRISMPLRLTSFQRNPTWGRARAKNMEAIARMSKTRFVILRPGETLSVNLSSKCPEANLCNAALLLL